MHLAICDDNIADRKQTERLANREADRRISEGDPMYIDSFGNAEALLKTPMQYDAFLIDIRNTEGMTSLKVLESLREKGVTAPVCIVYPRDSKEKPAPEDNDYPADTLFLAKPIRPEELRELITEISKNLIHRVSSIELRSEFDTLYVAENEIMYATAEGLKTKVTLTEGRSILIRGDVSTLFDEIKGGHNCFVMPSINSIINIDHIVKMRLRTAEMPDGTRFKIERHVLDYVKAYMDGLI